MRSKFLFLVFALVILVSQKSYSQWTFAGGVTGAGTNPSISVVDQNTVWVVGGPSGVTNVWLSTNGGANFTLLGSSGLTPKNLWCVWATSVTTAFVGNGGDAGGQTGGDAEFFRTTNGGANWVLVGNTGGTGGFINAITFSKTMPTFGIAQSDPPTGAGQPFWVSKTTNGGANWTVTNPPGVGGNASAQNSIVVVDDQWYGFGLNASARVYFTSNGGTSWTQGTLTGLSGTFTSGFAMSSNKLNGIATTSTSLPTVAVTSNGGTTWTAINSGAGLTSTITSCKFIENSNVCYVSGTTGASGVIRKSTNGGLNWTTMTTAGLTGVSHMEFVRNGNNIYGYAIAADGSVLKLADVVTGINDPIGQIPSEYKLEQNYPNPFNPSTTIKFSIPTSSHVTLKVYNAAGKEVASILSDFRSAGTYTEQFVAPADLSSGVYFYRLSAGNFVDTRKFMLVK
jgi:hypothetical protein